MPADKLIRYHNFCAAMKMLCEKMGWNKAYSWYIIGRDVESIGDGRKKEFIRIATHLLAANYDGMRTWSNPALSPRLLPSASPSSQPIRYPDSWKEEENVKIQELLRDHR